MAMENYLVPLKTKCVYFDDKFLSEHEANEAYEILKSSTHWEKTAKINRWVALYEEDVITQSAEDPNSNGSSAAAYQYRDAPGAAHVGFSEHIQRLQQKAQEWYREHTNQDIQFNVCLLNFYENGQQRIGWHSDREEIGRTTPIASISLGATRQFLLRAKSNGMHDRASIEMTPGSIIWMENACQHEYLHSVPKQSAVLEGRINLTFRCKDHSTAGEVEHVARDAWLSNLVGDAETPANAVPVWSPPTTIANDSSSFVFGDDATMETVQDGDVISFLIKTSIGTERFCAAEIMEVLCHDTFWRIVARPHGLDGYVACCRSSNTTNSEQPIVMTGSLMALRSAHYILEYTTHFDLQDLTNDKFPEPQLLDGETLYQYFKQCLLDESIVVQPLVDLNKTGGTFRCTCERVGGPHAFRAPHVEYELGGAMMEYYKNCTPKMEDYDLNIRTDVVGHVVVVGNQINSHDLSKERHFLKFRNAVTVKTNLAYDMVKCANIQPGNLLVDPFCGSGTILLEAMDVYCKQIKCIGLDVSKRSADGARENALAENFKDDICQFLCSDARSMRRHLKDESVNAIVTNLPWGVMTGKHESLATMYEIFLRISWYVLKDGARIVMLVLRGLQITRILRKLSGRYRLLSVQVVRTTNNLPSIVVVEKLAVDDLRESIKGQLSYYSQYVNVSPEIYEAMHNETVDAEDGNPAPYTG